MPVGASVTVRLTGVPGVTDEGRNEGIGKRRLTSFEAEQKTVAPGTSAWGAMVSGTRTSTSLPAGTEKTVERDRATRRSEMPKPTGLPPSEANWRPSWRSRARAVWKRSHVRPSRSFVRRLTVPTGVPRCPSEVGSRAVADDSGRRFDFG